MKETLNIASAEAVDFYPTPEELAEKIISSLDISKIHTILEPSAGKGDLLRLLAKEEFDYNLRRNFSKINFDVDCIELDPNLRQILKYNFGERKKDLQKRKKEIENKYGGLSYIYETKKYSYHNGKDYVPLPKEEQEEIDNIDNEYSYFFENGIHVVHDDFLTYQSFKTYDLIIMNPPFSNGDRHLLKALKLQENGGNIICILNAETIRNPYTATRKALLNQLEEYDASIEYIKNAFSAAERKTDVEIAVIKVSIPYKTIESDIFKKFQKADNYVDTFDTSTELEVTDYIKAIVNKFNMEVKCGIELINQYRALIPYMSVSFEEGSYDSQKPILRLTDSNDRGYESVRINEYLKHVRYKYWSALLSNKKFVGKLTSKLQSEYRTKVDNLSNYDFSEFNIYSLSAEMNSQIKRGVEEETLTMFDRLTSEHTYYPEMQKNKHYYDGWKTNKAHKIGKKVIIPCYGVFDSWYDTPRTYEARSVLEDIERVLNFLDGGMTREVNSWEILKSHFEKNETKNIELRFFKATFYKKGTVHLVFTCPELIERFNIFAGQRKGWLPPNYGRTSYRDMTKDEKDVVDSFQGEKAYSKILEKSNYYLKPIVSNNVLMLEE